MLEYMQQQSLFMYIIFGVGVVGVLSRLFLYNRLHRMAKNAESMGASNKKFLKVIKSNYEKGFLVAEEIQNTDAFVERYMGKYKILHIPVAIWEAFNIEAIIISVTTCIVGLAYEWNNGYDGTAMGALFLLTVLVCAFLISAENILRVENKKQQLSANITDYLENHLWTHLAAQQERAKQSIAMEAAQSKAMKKVKEEVDTGEDVQFLRKCLEEMAAAKQELEDEALLEELFGDFLAET